MSKGSFTAGPWAISGVLEGRGDITISSGRLVVATAHNGVSFFDVINSRNPEQQWANARLIAAAPDLLEALELVSDLAGREWQEADGSRKGATDNSGKRMWFIGDDVMLLVRERIAKARGDA